MVKEVMMWLLSQRKRMDKALKKKILIGVGLLGILIVFGFSLTVYIGFKTVEYLAAKAPSQEQVGTLTQNLSAQVKELVVTATSTTCLAEIQSHMSFDVWLDRPFSENTTKLFRSCLETPTPGLSENPTKHIKGESNDKSSI